MGWLGVTAAELVEPETAKSYGEWLEEFAGPDPVRYVLDAIKNAIENAVKALAKKPDAIRRKIESKDFTGALLEVLQLAIPAFVVFVIVDLLCTKFVGIGLELEGLRKALQSFFRVDLFVSAIVGAWVGAGLNTPASQVANMIFRPAIPDQSTILQAYLKGKVDDSEMKDIMARHGVPDKYIDLAVDLADRKPSLGEIGRMYQYVDISDGKLDYFLTENLVVDDYCREVYKKYWKSLRLRDEYSVYQSTLRTDYVDGLLSESELIKELKAFKVSTDEMNVFLQNCTKMLNRRLTRWAIETAIWYYRKGLINEDALYRQLLRLDVRSEVANSITRLEAAKKGIMWEAPS